MKDGTVGDGVVSSNKQTKNFYMLVSYLKNQTCCVAGTVSHSSTACRSGFKYRYSFFFFKVPVI